MIAILTGDIIGSKKLVATENWIQPLQKILYNFGTTPKNWEIQRGDSFQLEIEDPYKALETALKIKAAVKQVKNMDVRIAIGLGQKTFDSNTISSSNGSAFIRSYKCFDEMRRKKRTLSISSGDEKFDGEWNLLFRFAMTHADQWSTSIAGLADLTLRFPEHSQQQLADQLNITQASVSSGFKRSQLYLVKEMLQLYRKSLIISRQQ